MTQRFHFWVYIEGTQNTNLKEHEHPCVHCSIIIIAKLWKQQQVLANRQVDKKIKENVKKKRKVAVHIYYGILLSH